MSDSAFERVPSIWRGLGWALRSQPGSLSARWRLAARLAWGLIFHQGLLRRWMEVAFEMHARGLMPDLPAAFLRPVRPFVHRDLSIQERCVQLIDHTDWLSSALAPAALRQLVGGPGVVLANMSPPRGYRSISLRLQRAPDHSPEGELRLTLTVVRDARVQSAQPADVAVLGFSCFWVQGKPCLVIGGVRGQRQPGQRLTEAEVTEALSGWRAPVLMMRVMQELARAWDLHLVGLDPASHPLHGWTNRLSGRDRETARRISSSYNRLWKHFEAQDGPPGWVMLPLQSDDRLASTAMSPEKRARQIQRADYWIRTANLLRQEFRGVLLPPDAKARADRAVEHHTLQGVLSGYDDSRRSGLTMSSVLESVPGSVL